MCKYKIYCQQTIKFKTERRILLGVVQYAKPKPHLDTSHKRASARVREFYMLRLKQSNDRFFNSVPHTDYTSMYLYIIIIYYKTLIS